MHNKCRGLPVTRLIDADLNYFLYEASVNFRYFSSICRIMPFKLVGKQMNLSFYCIFLNTLQVLCPSSRSITYTIWLGNKWSCSTCSILYYSQVLCNYTRNICPHAIPTVSRPWSAEKFWLVDRCWYVILLLRITCNRMTWQCSLHLLCPQWGHRSFLRSWNGTGIGIRRRSQ